MSGLMELIEYLGEPSDSDLEKAMAAFDKNDPETVKRLRDHLMFEISQMEPCSMKAIAVFVERGRKLSELSVAARRQRDG